MKRAYSDFFDDFVEVASEPKWLMLPRFSSEGSRFTGEPPRDNFAEAAATEDKANRERAGKAKANILEFLVCTRRLVDGTARRQGDGRRAGVHGARGVMDIAASAGSAPA